MLIKGVTYSIQEGEIVNQKVGYHNRVKQKAKERPPESLGIRKRERE